MRLFTFLSISVLAIVVAMPSVASQVDVEDPGGGNPLCTCLPTNPQIKILYHKCIQSQFLTAIGYAGQCGVVDCFPLTCSLLTILYVNFKEGVEGCDDDSDGTYIKVTQAACGDGALATYSFSGSVAAQAWFYCLPCLGWILDE